MKLYTEDQVIQMTQAACTAGQNNNPFIFWEVYKNITPIELPSDENVHLEARCYEDYNEYMDVLQSEKALSRYNGFIRGVDWMRDKIQGGNK